MKTGLTVATAAGSCRALFSLRPRPCRCARGIGEGLGRVDWLDDRGTAFKQETPVRVVEFVATPAALGAQVGGQVLGAEKGAAHPGAGASDVAHANHA